MNTYILAGIALVHLALVAYTLGVTAEQRSRRISAWTLKFLFAGVLFDMIATTCMALGSSKGLFTPHGAVGMAALAAMIYVAYVAWRHRQQHGDGEVSDRLHFVFRLAFAAWIVAYITGAVLAMGR